MFGATQSIDFIGALGLRRTIAAARISYGNEDAFPNQAGSGNPHFYFRAIVLPEGEDPPEAWPFDPNSETDDIFFEPVVWNTMAFVPANITFGRPELFIANGSLNPAVVDVKSQRNFAFAAHPVTHWWLGPISSEGSGAGFDLMTGEILIRHLWDKNPSS